MNNYDINLVKKLEDEIYKLKDTLILQIKDEEFKKIINILALERKIKNG